MAACRLQLVRRIGTVGSVVAVHWHSRLNQVFMGTGTMLSLTTATKGGSLAVLSRGLQSPAASMHVDALMPDEAALLCEVTHIHFCMDELPTTVWSQKLR